MNIQDRIKQVEQTFNTKQAERQQHLDAAEGLLVEMTKLQGAFAELTDLLKADEEAKPSVKVKDEGKK